MARAAAEGMDEVESIDLAIAPGNRAPRQRATIDALMASLGAPLRVMRDGEWRTVSGWSSPRVFQFPPPVGPSLGRLVDAPDLALLPPLFGARRVEFRVGAELSVFNRAASALALLRRRGVLRDPRRLTPLARIGMAALGAFGHDWGAVGVEVAGRRDGRPATRRISLIADRDGHRIPVMPAAVMAERLMRPDPPIGLAPIDRWISRGELERECRRRGYRLVIEQVESPARK
jgi:saccharopine dehydrogenase-like NADP-dependent oxidoreductase